MQRPFLKDWKAYTVERFLRTLRDAKTNVGMFKIQTLESWVANKFRILYSYWWVSDFSTICLIRFPTLTLCFVYPFGKGLSTRLVAAAAALGQFCAAAFVTHEGGSSSRRTESTDGRTECHFCFSCRQQLKPVPDQLCCVACFAIFKAWPWKPSGQNIGVAMSWEDPGLKKTCSKRRILKVGWFVLLPAQPLEPLCDLGVVVSDESSVPEASRRRHST